MAAGHFLALRRFFLEKIPASAGAVAKIRSARAIPIRSHGITPSVDQVDAVARRGPVRGPRRADRIYHTEPFGRRIPGFTTGRMWPILSRLASR